MRTRSKTPQADVYLYPVNMANADQLPGQADEETIEQQPVNSGESNAEQVPNDNKSNK